MTVPKGFVVPAGGGKHFDSPTPGRFFVLKLLGRETGDSIMMFERRYPPAARASIILHHDSDEVAWVISGEFTVDPDVAALVQQLIETADDLARRGSGGPKA